MTSRLNMTGWWAKAVTIASAILVSSAAAASGTQTPIDRSDPAVVAEEEREAETARPPVTDRPSLTTTEGPDTISVAEPFVAGAIRIEGATILPPATFAAAIEPYLGRPLDSSDLRALSRAVADAARGAGFGLATAWVPAQSIGNGLLRVHLDEGRIDAIQAGGPAAAVVERLLRPLAGGEPVRTAALERRLLLARDIAGVSVRSATLVRSGDRNVLRVDTGRERVRARASIDNWGTEAIGPVRARLSLDALGVFGFGDALTIGGMLTPVRPREFQMVHANYAIPVGRNGATARASGFLSRSDAGGSLRNRDLEGDGSEIQAGFSYPLIRTRRENLWGHVDFGLRDSKLTREGLEIRDDRIVTLAGTLYGAGHVAGGTLRTRISLVRGLEMFGATVRGDPLASRRDAGGVFTKVRFWTDYTRSLGGGFSALATGEGQLASRPLLASEEMGLGGRAFLRGYDYREFSGDRGAAAAAELRFDLDRLPPPLRRAQVYSYADAGRVTNLRGGFGGGSLASAGGGVRISFNRRIEASVELGIPLAHGGDGRRPNPRFSFTLSTIF